MKRTLAYSVIAGYFALVILGIYVVGHYWECNDQAPEQPIAYSHVRHVYQNGLACTHCHKFTDKSIHAGVPNLDVCAKCHAGMASDNPEIKKLQAYIEEGRPVVWNKVHVLPWHAHFSHKRHIKAGKQCEECHSDVSAMPRIRRARSFEMGWCLSCHRKNNAPQECWTCHK